MNRWEAGMPMNCSICNKSIDVMKEEHSIVAFKLPVMAESERRHREEYFVCHDCSNDSEFLKRLRREHKCHTK